MIRPVYVSDLISYHSFPCSCLPATSVSLQFFKHKKQAPSSGPFHLLFPVPGMPFAQYKMVCHFISLRAWLKGCYLQKSLPSLLQDSNPRMLYTFDPAFSSEHLLSDEILYTYWFTIYLPNRIL